MTVFKAVAELCDVVSHVVYCREDSSMMLILENNSVEFWLPSSKTTNSSWNAQSNEDIHDIFGSNVGDKSFLRLYRVWLPQQNYIYHCIYLLQIDDSQKKKARNTYGRYRGKVTWVVENELTKMLFQEKLRSPELLELFQLCKGNIFNAMLTDGAQISMLTNEFTYCGTFIEVTEQIFINASNDTIYTQIIEAASFSRDVQSALLQEFVFLCFPAIYMSQPVFSRFMMELGWSREEAPFVFRAADMAGHSGLSFREFLYVLAAVEPNTSHGGGPAELRCRYIFRFFDRDRDNLLNYNEFKLLIASVRKSKMQPIDNASVNREAESCFRGMGLKPDVNVLSLVDFLRIVGDLRLRGTSQIFRSATSVIQYLQNLRERESRYQKSLATPAKADPKTMKSLLKESSMFSKGASSNKHTNYEVGVHTIRLQKSGTLISIDQIWNVTSAISASSTNQQTLMSSSRRGSQDQFSQTSITNEILKSLRYLMQMNKEKSAPVKGKPVKMEPYIWGQLDSVQFAKNFITICIQVRELFRDEPRLLKLESPAYIMGDLHGNFTSLLYFEKVLWHLGPGLCPCNLIFLGDYVDRGLYSIEVIAYLFCYKVQTPRKMYLLRGNHEIREIQKMFTFYAECINKFGEKVGVDVWNAVNSAFDTMPVAATIDMTIFCCHGGIPPPWLCPTVEAITHIPCPLYSPDEQSSLAWEILWNDPISKPKQVTDEVALELLSNDGFAINRRRGTAHVFSSDALEKFLNTNGFTHVIRAHEVALAGFNVLHKGRLLTVFSSSKYCGGQNEAACILADQGKLRILRLETG